MEIVKTFSIEEINQQLHRILQFPAFEKSPTLSRFLEFIISETINEKSQYIKEYSIAVNVLNRPHNFNPHDDAIVRIHAGRLRRALNDYYLTEGIYDHIVIQIPKGSYVPQFDAGIGEKQAVKISADSSAPAINPVVAIFPFRISPHHPGTDEFSLNLSEQLCAELSCLGDISVIGYYSTEMIEKIGQNMLEAGKSIGADYILSGLIQSDDQHTRIRVSLLFVATGEVVVTRSFEKEIISPCILKIQDEIVQKVIDAIENYAFPFNIKRSQMKTDALNSLIVSGGTDIASR